MDFVMVWEGFLRWVELHPGLASWVQAFGSLLAIGVAIWLSSRESRYRIKIIKEARRNAILRAVSLVKSARRKLDDSLETWAAALKTNGVKRILVGSMNEALAPLRGFESGGGVDFDICGHVIDARNAIETAGQKLRIALEDDGEEDFYVSPVRDCISMLETAIAGLEEINQSPSIWSRLFARSSAR